MTVHPAPGTCGTLQARSQQNAQRASGPALPPTAPLDRPSSATTPTSAAGCTRGAATSRAPGPRPSACPGRGRCRRRRRALTCRPPAAPRGPQSRVRAAPSAGRGRGHLVSGCGPSGPRSAAVTAARPPTPAGPAVAAARASSRTKAPTPWAGTGAAGGGGGHKGTSAARPGPPLRRPNHPCPQLRAAGPPRAPAH